MKQLKQTLSLLLCVLMLASPVCVFAAGKPTLNHKKYTLNVKETLRLYLSNNENEVEWSSSKKSIASVSSKGKVTAKKKGSATISAKTGGKKYNCKIKVEAPKLNKTKLTLYIDKAEKIRLTGTTQKIIWKSSDTKVASVDKNGIITATSEGTATVTATAGKTKYACVASVKKDPYKKGARLNPFRIGEVAIFNGINNEYVTDTYKLELTLIQVIRGNDAWDLVRAGSMHNERPGIGKEYMLAKFKVKILASDNDRRVEIYNALFDFVSKDGVEYDRFVTIAGIQPSFSTMYVGATAEGYTHNLINNNDTPLIVFQDYIDGGIWFATN